MRVEGDEKLIGALMPLMHHEHKYKLMQDPTSSHLFFGAAVT